ncbi:MAG TPA: hypothetical protein VIM14_21020 [Polyangia bacterium]
MEPVREGRPCAHGDPGQRFDASADRAHRGDGSAPASDCTSTCACASSGGTSGAGQEPFNKGGTTRRRF